MENRMILVIGGARSGKSTFAQGLAAETEGRVCFLATAEARDGEMHDRIERHRLARPQSWRTFELEAGTRLSDFPTHADAVLFDCFTVFLSNLMAEKGLDWEPEKEDLMPEADVLRLMDETENAALEMVDGLRKAARNLIIVSNEVGLGLVPPYRLGRIFRDLAGRLNQRLAERADEAYLISAGLSMRLKGEPGRED